MAHGLWSVGNGLLLWAETDGHPVADPAQLPPVPVDWSGPLQEALSPFELPLRPTLLLPVDGVLVPRGVPASALATPDAADLLLEIAFLHAGADGAWSLSPELRFLAEVASGIARWVYSGRVVPTLRRRGGGWTAAWTLVDDGPIRAWRTQLEAAWPAILRAEVRDGVSPNPADVLADLLDELCDAIVLATLRLSPPRAASTGHPLLSALDSGDRLVLAEAESNRLAAGLQRWASSSSLDGPDVVFRLCEPPDDEKS
ncbi:MAG: hypothetical protein ABI251_07985, partial [Mycobacteriaceae bacterium]